MSLSCTILALNDSEMIPRALSYAVTIANEIVVVDGGSTDNTVGVVREFAETSPVPVKLFEHPMPDSFSLQRNYGIEQCTGDWILHQDCDETYSRGMKERLLPSLDSIPAEIVGLSIPTWYLADEQHLQAGMIDADPHIRLFRNMPGVRYADTVHEGIALNGTRLIAHPSHWGELERSVLRYVPDVRLVHWGSLRSDEAYAAWRSRWERFAQRSIEAGINVDAVVRHPAAGNAVPEGEIE